MADKLPEVIGATAPPSSKTAASREKEGRYEFFDVIQTYLHEAAELIDMPQDWLAILEHLFFENGLDLGKVVIHQKRCTTFA